MDNNRALKKIKIACELRDEEIAECLRLGKHTPTRNEVHAWIVGDGHREYRPMPDTAMEAFLDGLILFMRGPK